MTTTRLALCLFLAAGLAACEKVDSSSIKTAGIYADFGVTAHGDGASRVTATLRVGGPLSNTFVELARGDDLVATSGAQQHDLAEVTDLFNVVVYAATFSGDAADQAFTVAFERADDVSAPDSTATLPAPFELTAPAAGATAARDAGLTITWDGAGEDDALELSISGTCTNSVSRSIPDTGSYTVPAGDLTPTGAQSSCDATITVRRERLGTVDPAFGEGGTFLAAQERTVTILSTP